MDRRSFFLAIAATIRGFMQWLSPPFWIDEKRGIITFRKPRVLFMKNLQLKAVIHDDDDRWYPVGERDVVFRLKTYDAKEIELAKQAVHRKWRVIRPRILS